MNLNFFHTTKIQYELKSLRAQVAAFESGEKYMSMIKEHEKQLRAKDKIIRDLEKSSADSHRETVTVRKIWMEVFEDLEKEYKALIEKLKKQLCDMKKRALKAESERDEAYDKKSEKQRELYRVLTELEEQKGINQKLRAQLNRDYENSSKPSSDKPNHKPIPNSREKTGRKPGAQPGHTGHKRKKLEPTEAPIFVAAPEEIDSNPDFYQTGKEIRKQVIDVKMVVTVTEYYAIEYRNRKTGARYHATFPPEINNEVNYGTGLKALAFYLNNYCNVSIEKTKEFLSELTDGVIEMSAGMINGLGSKISANTEEERKKIFASLLQSPVMYSDATVGRVNGKGKAVIVCASPNEVLYSFKDHKGHEGLKGTPVEDYQQTLVHDHDITYYSYGGDHQECLAHVLRYLKDSMDNEPELTWNKEMHKFLQSLIHEVKQERDIGEVKCLEYEAEYDRILDVAQQEYEYEPPSKYYREGYNLQKRLRKYRDNHLFFLRHPEVDYTNNLSERYCRRYKTKQKQAQTFRSQENAEYYCDALGVIETGKLKGQSAFQTIKLAFE